mgnify:CR=1 FL=1
MAWCGDEVVGDVSLGCGVPARAPSSHPLQPRSRKLIIRGDGCGSRHRMAAARCGEVETANVERTIPSCENGWFVDVVTLLVSSAAGGHTANTNHAS